MRALGAVSPIRNLAPSPIHRRVSVLWAAILISVSAVVVAMATPHFTVCARDGSFQITQVPPGRYKLEIWYELASESELKSQSREFEIASGDNTLSPMTLHSSDAPHDHLNKYGEPYPLDKPSKY
jgi:hypothetical protein